MKDNKKFTPSELYELAREKFYKVYDFPADTKKEDKTWIRVGVLPDVTKEIRWNYFNGERLLCDDPFDMAENFCGGTAVVIRNHEYNVLREDGTLVFDKWYHYVSKIDDGKHYQVEVKKDEYGIMRKEAFADADGNIISEWYDQTMTMMNGNLFCVTKGEKISERKSAVYDVSKNQVISEWYDTVCLFMGEPKWCRVTNNKLNNLLKPDGTLYFDKWSKKAIEVNKDGSCQLLTEDGAAWNASVVTGEMTRII